MNNINREESEQTFENRLSEKIIQDDENGKQFSISGVKKPIYKNLGLLIGGAAAVALLIGTASIFNFQNQFLNSQNQTLQQLNHEEENKIFTEYLQFIAKYGKLNMNEQEFKLRYQIFQKKYKMIEEHNKLYESGKAQFDMEINKFADLTDEEFIQKYTGIKISKERRERAEKTSKRLIQQYQNQSKSQRHLQSANLDYKDWYKEGKVTRPMDQSGCGACWAFSAVAAVESLAVISGKESQLKEYSLQQLIDCDSQNYGCDGGWMYEGFQYVSSKGIVLKDDYEPFSRFKSSCKISDDDLQRKKRISNIGYIENDGRNNEELRELLRQQPISAGMLTSGMLSSYRSGVMTENYLHCSNPSNEVNHGILIVGYGQVGQHHGDDSVYGSGCLNYWIVRNSWGPDWGEEGFMRICADNLGSGQTPLGTCLLNKYAVWPTTNPDDIDLSQKMSN